MPSPASTMLTIVSVLVVSRATCGDGRAFVKRIQDVLPAGRATLVDDERLIGEIRQTHAAPGGERMLALA